MSPGLALGVLFALIGAQVTRLLVPASGYLRSLGLAALGVIAGELAALGLGAGGPSLGPVHPVADALGMAVLEMVGAIVAGPRSHGRAASPSRAGRQHRRVPPEDPPPFPR
ncbi:MAG: hypothetical protein ABSA40_05585 [Candidatus Dormibacteria bacterium]